MTTPVPTPAAKEAFDPTKPGPCPFCGGKASVTHGTTTLEDWPHRAFSRVYCEACQTRQLFHRDDAEAVAAWNQRTVPVPIPASADAAPDTRMSEAAEIAANHRACLSLLDDIEEIFDKQTYDERKHEDFDAPDDAEYSVNITAGLMRRLPPILGSGRREPSDATKEDAQFVRDFLGRATTPNTAESDDGAFVEDFAAKLLDAWDFDLHPWEHAAWPEHQDDDGYRGGGYIKLQPHDVRARMREFAARVITISREALARRATAKSETDGAQIATLKSEIAVLKATVRFHKKLSETRNHKYAECAELLKTAGDKLNQTAWMRSKTDGSYDEQIALAKACHERAALGRTSADQGEKAK